MKIEKDKVVFISYTLSSVTDQQVIEHIPASKPFGYIQGQNSTLPAFEEKMEGLEVGAEFDFILHQEEAFGEYYE